MDKFEIKITFAEMETLERALMEYQGNLTELNDEVKRSEMQNISSILTATRNA